MISAGGGGDRHRGGGGDQSRGRGRSAGRRVEMGRGRRKGTATAMGHLSSSVLPFFRSSVLLLPCMKYLVFFCYL